MTQDTGVDQAGSYTTFTGMKMALNANLNLGN